jgi:hypothetical protein
MTMDHDQRFKTLIREFFSDFLQLFFAPWAARFDLTRIEWLDKEVLPNPPQGTRHQLDLVARLRTIEQLSELQGAEPEAWLALIHIEIESPEQTTLLKPRLPRYYIHLREQHELPVLPIVLYLKVGLDGIGVDVYEERFGELCPLRFEYLYVGLPGLDAVQYVEGENWLGVALSALMRIPREQTAWLGAEALRRLADAPLNDQHRFLLADCVEAYLPLDEQQQLEYERLMLGTSHGGLQAMNKTTFEKGIERGFEKGVETGIEKGREQELQRSLLQIGRRRMGPPPASIESRIRAIDDLPWLEALNDSVWDTTSWEQLLGEE